jgi:outer membrane protein assembly factor BamB
MRITKRLIVIHHFLLAVAGALLCLPLERSALGVEGRTNTANDPIEVAPSDWPWWRGPNRNGVAAADQKPPIEWNESKNVLWKTPVPGRGHGSPTVVGNQIFLATADHERQSVLCYDRRTGKELWNTVVHKGGIATKANTKASQASSTVACDGKRVFVTFLNDKAIYATALSRDGKQLWQAKIGDYVLHQGYASSPALFESLVIVSADNKGGGTIAAFDRATGDIVWKRSRPKLPNYSSPSIQQVAGRAQLLFTGCKLVSSFDPLTGKKLWEIDGATEECVATTVTDGKHVFSSGGYPKNHLAAIRADGTGKIVWENKIRVYVPSMLIQDGYLYVVADAGIAMCFDSSTGKEIWKHRLGGTFSSSPVLVGEHIYVTNESGETFIYKASPRAFTMIGKNELNDEVFATPTFCNSQIYMRVAKQTAAGRQEWLYCLGAASEGTRSQSP